MPEERPFNDLGLDHGPGYGRKKSGMAETIPLGEDEKVPP